MAEESSFRAKVLRIYSSRGAVGMMWSGPTAATDYNGSEEEQRPLDSTCRKLHRFLNQHQR